MFSSSFFSFENERFGSIYLTYQWNHSSPSVPSKISYISHHLSNSSLKYNKKNNIPNEIWQEKKQEYEECRDFECIQFRECINYMVYEIEPPKTVLEQIESHMARFFWGSSEGNQWYHWNSTVPGINFFFLLMKWVWVSDICKILVSVWPWKGGDL